MAEFRVIEKIAAFRIVPVVAVDDPDIAISLADALLEGGLSILEITFRTKVAAEAISALREQRPDLLVGAGTLLTARDVEVAYESGAQFGVSPGLDRTLVDQAAKYGMPYIPGVATATEIQQALSLGCRLLKFFPAASLGGPSTLKALSAPFQHTGVQFLATGGVNDQNIHHYLEMENVVAIGGSWIASADDLATGRWDDIRQRSSEAVRRFARSPS